jgi:hypothetical protein
MLCCSHTEEGAAQRDSEVFDEADADLTAPIPGIRPDLLLIKQVDQVSPPNGRLLPAGGSLFAGGN